MLLSALAATAFLPGDSRFEVMLLAQRGEGAAAAALVHAVFHKWDLTTGIDTLLCVARPRA